MRRRSGGLAASRCAVLVLDRLISEMIGTFALVAPSEKSALQSMLKPVNQR